MLPSSIHLLVIHFIILTKLATYLVDSQEKYGRARDGAGEGAGDGAGGQEKRAVTEHEKMIMHEEIFLEKIFKLVRLKEKENLTVNTDDLEKLKNFLQTFSETPLLLKRGKSY